MKKRLLSILVAVLLVPALFAAGSKEGTTSTKKGEDYVKLDTWLVDEPTTITVLLSDASQQPLKNYAPAQREIFKETGIKLEYQAVPFSSYDEKKNILLATNNWPDVAYIKPDDIATYAPTGIFEPLSQYVNATTMPNYYALRQKYPELKNFNVNGEQYTFSVIQRGESANGFGPVIRTDLLKKHNLPIPETFDELITTLVKLKEIYPDSIPYTGRKGTTQLLKTTSYMLGSGYDQTGIYYDYDKQMYLFGPAHSEFKAVLSWLKECYATGVLDPDFATSTSEQMQSKLSSGKSFFYLDNSGFGQNYTKALQKIAGNENAELQIIPIPENSFGQRRAISYSKDIADRHYAVNAAGKHKDTVIKLIDYLYGRRGSDISNYGVPGYSFEYNEKGDPEFLVSYLEKFRDATPSSYYAVYSDLGITKLNFCFWACNTKTWFEIEKALGNWGPFQDEYWTIINNDEAYKQPMIKPAFTVEESEKITDIVMELTTMLEQEYNKYIMGLEPIDSWDKVIERCNALGVQELEDIYNTANNR